MINIQPRRLLMLAAMTGIAALFFYAAAASAYRLPVYAPGDRPKPDGNGEFHYRGAVHVHSTHSHDGRGTVAEIAAAAKNNDLDFVVVTDHNDMSAAAEQGLKDGVLIIAGLEVSTDRGHFLSIGLQRELKDGDRRGSRFFETASALGGWNVVSHPFGGDNPWRGIEQGGFDAIEIWNLKAMAENEMIFPYPGLLLPAVAYPFNAAYSVQWIWRRPDEAVAYLGRTLHERRISVVCGADAHGFPPYNVLLGQCVNHVLTKERLTGDARHDIPVIIQGLKAGRIYAANDGIAHADTFAYSVERREGIRMVEMSLQGFPKASKASARIHWGGNEVGRCDRLDTKCFSVIPSTGNVLLEVGLAIPALFWGEKTVPWIYAVAGE